MRHSNVHTLLVEDDEDDFLIVKTLLSEIEETTFKIDWIADYDKAKQHLHSHRYDILLLDYRLGRNTGLDLVRYVQSIQYPAPCILLTGQGDHDVDVMAGETGAADYLLKGELSPSSLERSIRYALERRDAEIEREALTEKLLETSHQLGKAEVAASVLHNVGNVLNSINVSATHLTKLLEESYIHDIGEIAKMVQDHQSELAGFFTQHSRGKLIPTYLVQLGEQTSGQHQAMLDEIQTLTKNLEHVKQIIRAQQSHATSTHQLEPLVASELMEQALTINLQALSQHHIEIVRDYAEIPPIMSNKHQILQILVNLIRNAIHAMIEKPAETPCLCLTIDQSPDGERIQLSVQDSGIGIHPDYLTRIFSQGFTTKQEGHGLGLHSSALAAQSLQGSLQAFSEGEGQGARFTLSLPSTPVEVPIL